MSAVSVPDVTAWWTTQVSDIEPGSIRLRGFSVQDLIERASFVETIWMMVLGDFPSPQQAALLEKALVSSVDHGPQAPSIAAARMAATCGVGLHGAMSTGVGLLGDVHGGAGQQCVALLQELVTDVEARVGEGAAVEGARRYVVREVLEASRASGEYVPGFGHRFHPRDPRRDPLIRAAEHASEAGTISGRALAVALEIEEQLSTGRRPVPMNIDGATAIIYAELGLPPEVARGMFILSRSVGILSHSWEEFAAGRRIKGPIPPPLLPDYVGASHREVRRGQGTGE